MHRRYNIEVKRDRTPAGRVSRRKTFGLRVCIRGKGLNRTDFVLTWDAMANLAFEKQASRSTLARMYQVSRRTAGRVNIYVVACGMQTQLEKLKTLQAAFDMFPPEWIICDLMWDETSERLCLNALAGSSSAQQASTWEVLVSRITLTWSFGRTIFHTEFIMPPVPLITNKAEHIFVGLFAPRQQADPGGREAGFAEGYIGRHPSARNRWPPGQ